MNFADRITRSPIPHDADRGADAAALFPDLGEGLREVIRGTAGCSPYLADLLRRETGWITDAMADPEEAVETLLAGVGDITLDGIVDVLDLLAVIAAWGNPGGPEDINTDGMVDVLDLLAVIAAWGPCP